MPSCEFSSRGATRYNTHTQRRGVLVASQSVLGNAIAVNGELTKTVAERHGRENVTVDMETAVLTASVGEDSFFSSNAFMFFSSYLFLVLNQGFLTTEMLTFRAEAKISRMAAKRCFKMFRKYVTL